MITGWTNEAGETVTADQPPMAYSDAVYTAIWVEKPTTITVKAQVKEKYGFSYQWKTIKIETYEMDTEEISVAELVDMLALDGYSFDEANSAYTADSIITPSRYADTTVTLRFKT